MTSPPSLFIIFLRSIFLPNPVIERLLTQIARFVLIAGAIDGDSNSLQYTRAKSWSALSCIHAELAWRCVAARQPNPYNNDDSTRGTDILIDQYKVDSH